MKFIRHYNSDFTEIWCWNGFKSINQTIDVLTTRLSAHLNWNLVLQKAAIFIHIIMRRNIFWANQKAESCMLHPHALLNVKYFLAFVWASNVFLSVCWYDSCVLSGCHASCHQGGNTGGSSQGDQAGDAQLTKTEGQQEIAGHWGSFSLNYWELLYLPKLRKRDQRNSMRWSV